ncbi:hypothetical protein F8M41_020585 [Gigaspora margarita]|uniref:Uncharacterized protein n=1 Tax=Gigaspora margarita TaxID=4874 RepID=A0A8H4AIA8_GIGMA|nr:hypothetical protein F8M41_020585 [Gigaspora margarita]
MTGDELFSLSFHDSNRNFIEGGGGFTNICNPDCPTNQYQINYTTNAPPNLPSNYSIQLDISADKGPFIVDKACGVSFSLSS